MVVGVLPQRGLGWAVPGSTEAGGGAGHEGALCLRKTEPEQQIQDTCTCSTEPLASVKWSSAAKLDYRLLIG
jgi:hypothetical protein